MKIVIKSLGISFDIDGPVILETDGHIHNRTPGKQKQYLLEPTKNGGLNMTGHSSVAIQHTHVRSIKIKP